LGINKGGIGMKRKITIATLWVLLSASILFTFISPLIPFALDVDYYDTSEVGSKLFIFGAIISFVFAVILILICEFWKEKTKEEQLNEINNDKH
jgi:uncharacterized membrane protein